MIEREQPHIVLERLRQRFRRRLAVLLRAVLQQVERRLDRELLAGHVEAQARHRLVEQPVPGRIAAHRFLVEQLLDAVLELIRLFLAHVLDPGPVMAEDGIVHRLFEQRVVDAVEFEREEQKMQRDRGDALLHVAVEFRAHRIGGVAGINERRIGDDAAEQILHRLVAPHGFGERGPAGALRREIPRACPCSPSRRRCIRLSPRSRSRRMSGESIAG